MAPFILRRLAQAAAMIVLMSIVVFAALFVVGDPTAVLAAPNATDADIAALRSLLGLDRPLYVQYGAFVASALEGEFGKSFFYGVPAMQLVLSRLPATIELTIVAFIISVGIGLPVGLFAGMSQAPVVKRAVMILSALSFSVPTFWIGLVLIMVFSVGFGLTPAGGRGPTQTLLGIPVTLTSLDGWRHALLPAFALAQFNVGLVTRLVFTATREARLQDYVKFARAKGLGQGRILFVHILRNILIPIVGVLGLEIGSLLTGSIITETVFAWPGIGKLVIDAIYVLDRPVIVAFMMFTVATIVMVNLAVDILYGVIDPRVRIRGAA